jgi:hypothetical protein
MVDLSELDDEEYYGELKLMFATRGWNIFLAEMAENAQYLNSVEDTRDLEDLWYRKGQLAVLGNILNTEFSLKLAQEQDDETTEGL